MKGREELRARNLDRGVPSSSKPIEVFSFRGLPVAQIRKAGYLDISAITPRVKGERGADRAFIAGRSGSGKSYAARQILSTYGWGDDTPPAFRCGLVIIDPNYNFDFPSNKTTSDINDVLPTKKFPVVTYRPSVEDRGDPIAWNSLFSRLFYYQGPLMVYIDELYAAEVLFGVKRLPGGNYLNAYLTQGRARGKGMIAAAQRPFNIPKNIIEQSEWFYMFDLPGPESRQLMSEVMGRYGEGPNGLVDIRDRESLGRYEFWFKGPDNQYALKMKVR